MTPADEERADARAETEARIVAMLSHDLEVWDTAVRYGPADNKPRYLNYIELIKSIVERVRRGDHRAPATGKERGE